MSITPRYYHKDELLKAGITPERLQTASDLICHVFGEDWLEIHRKSFEMYKEGKYSMNKFFNQHPIYSGLTALLSEKQCYMVTIAEALSLFSKEASIKEMIERLKDHENVSPAVFELISATSFKDYGFEIIGLQVTNPDGNPVEIVANKDGQSFWIECKSTKNERTADGFHERLYQVLQKEYDSNKTQIIARGGMGFLITLERPILNDADFKRVKGIISGSMEIFVNNVPDEEFPNGFIEKDNAPMEITYDAFLMKSKNKAQIIKYIQENSVIGGGFRNMRKQSGTNLPHPDDLSVLEPDFDSMLGLSYPYEYESEIRSPENFEKQLKKKISQQKSLLEKGENVILLFDSESICSIEEAKIIAEKYTKYSRLSILVGEKEKMPFRYKFKVLLKGKEFPKFN